MKICVGKYVMNVLCDENLCIKKCVFLSHCKIYRLWVGDFSIRLRMLSRK